VFVWREACKALQDTEAPSTEVRRRIASTQASAEAAPRQNLTIDRKMHAHIADIERAQREYLAVVKKGKSRQEIDAASDEAKESICTHLQRFGAQQEPAADPELRRLWRSHRCPDRKAG
jgi:hypothetical protein